MGAPGVRVVLKGGLGNQIFQYAAGLNLAQRHETDLSLLFHRGPGWEFQLSPWGISRTRVSLLQDMIPSHRGRQILKRWWENRQRCLGNYRLDDSLGFNPDFDQIRPPIVLEGYFQSHKYLAPVEQKMREIFLQAPLIEFVSKCMADFGMPKQFVALHVRGGDYRQLRGIFTELGRDYYERGLTALPAEIESLPKVCFTNDFSYAKTIAPMADMFVDETAFLGLQWVHLLSMTKSEAIIGANSTFSWLGAWFSSVPDSRKVFPNNWFREPRLRQEFGLAHPDWVNISPGALS